MDTFTVSIAIGLIVSLLFTEFYGLSSGGMIVPGYLALHLHQPVSVALTLLAAVLTFCAVRLLARVAISSSLFADISCCRTLSFSCWEACKESAIWLKA